LSFAPPPGRRGGGGAAAAAARRCGARQIDGDDAHAGRPHPDLTERTLA
jgi:hypothetical protein